MSRAHPSHTVAQIARRHPALFLRLRHERESRPVPADRSEEIVMLSPFHPDSTDADIRCVVLRLRLDAWDLANIAFMSAQAADVAHGIAERLAAEGRRASVLFWEEEATVARRRAACARRALELLENQR